MGILLSELIKMQCFKKAKILSGKASNKSTHVSGITIIERPDIVNWIKGGELLLTSFYSIDKDLEAQKKLVKEVALNKAAALVIKTSNFLPKIDKEIVDLGNRLEFPIIEISIDTKYIDILYPVMGKLFNDQINRLNYYKDCHEKFTLLSLKMKGIEAVTKTLEELIDTPVAVFDSEFSLKAYSNEEYNRIYIDRKEMEKLINKEYLVDKLNIKLSENSDSVYTMIVEPIKVLNQIKGYLGVLEINKVLNNMDFIALEGAANTLRLEMLKDIAVNEVKLRYKGDLMDDLITGRFESLQSIYDRSNLLGWDLKRKNVVVLLRTSNSEQHSNKYKNSSEVLMSLREKIKRNINKISHYYMGSNIISTFKGDDVIILWPVEKSKDIKYTYNRVREFGNELKKNLYNKGGGILISVGVGSLAVNPTEIGKSFNEARDTVNFGYNILGKGSITFFEELGIYKLLCSYENREELKKFVPSDLMRLKKYDRDNNAELIDTFEMYLKCNLNAMKTAENLYIHYKTALYRLNRIKKIIDLDIENRESMLEMEVGLKILKMIY